MTSKIITLASDALLYLVLKICSFMNLFLFIFILEVFSIEILFLYLLEHIEKKWSNHGKPCPRIPADHFLAIKQILIDTV